MAEWSNAAVLKTVDCQRSGGSNPSLSAQAEKSPVSTTLTGLLVLFTMLIPYFMNSLSDLAVIFNFCELVSCFRFLKMISPATIITILYFDGQF